MFLRRLGERLFVLLIESNHFGTRLKKNSVYLESLEFSFDVRGEPGVPGHSLEIDRYHVSGNPGGVTDAFQDLVLFCKERE